MTQHFILRISMVVLLSCSCFTLASAQNIYDLNPLKLKLDLQQLTLNKLPVQELTREKVEAILGEPAFDDYSYMVEIAGPRIWYNYEGLFFWFLPENKDPNQILLSVTIYLVDDWDKLHNDIILPFPGEITPFLTSGYKVNDIKKLFKKYPVKIQSAADYRLQRSQSYGDTTYYNHDLVWVENKNGWVCFSCDEDTKYLDYITITRH